MFCKNCGHQMNDGENFCSACGAMNTTENTNTTGLQYDFVTVDTVRDEEKDEMAGQTFKWGLMSLIFSASGCLSLLGFIFSFIAKRKAKDFVDTFGQLEGRAKAGRVLGKIGFGVGLGYTIFWALYVIIIVLLVVAAVFGVVEEEAFEMALSHTVGL